MQLDITKVKKFLSTLFYSWGGDTPSEAIWAANEFLSILEDAYGYKFKNEFTEPYDDNHQENNYETVIKEIENLLKGRLV